MTSYVAQCPGETLTKRQEAAASRLGLGLRTIRRAMRVPGQDTPDGWQLLAGMEAGAIGGKVLRALAAQGVNVADALLGEKPAVALPEALAAHLEDALAEAGETAARAFPWGIDGARALAFLTEQVRQVAAHLHEHGAALHELYAVDSDADGMPSGELPHLWALLERAAVPPHLAGLLAARKDLRIEGERFVFAAPPPPAPAPKAGRRRQAR